MNRTWAIGSTDVRTKPQRPCWQGLRCAAIVVATVLIALLVSGCSSATPIGLGVKLVGKVVDHEAAEEWKQELAGQPLATADSKFGSRLNAYKDIRSDGRWVVYNAPMDPIGLQKIVVAVRQGRIAAVTKVTKFGSPTTGIPETLLYSSKAMGKSPAQCQISLELGEPLITARNESTGKLRQVYRAGLIQISGVTSPHYCILEFGSDNLCSRVDVVSENASSRSN